MNRVVWIVIWVCAPGRVICISRRNRGVRGYLLWTDRFLCQKITWSFAQSISMYDNSTISMAIFVEFVVIKGFWRIVFGREIMMANVVIMARTRGTLAVAIIVMTITTA